MKFKLQYGLQMVHVRKTTEDDLNDCHVVVLTSEMVYNPKEISDHYLDQECKGPRDPDNSKTFVNSTVRYIIKYRLESETLNHRVCDSSFETGPMSNLICRGY